MKKAIILLLLVITLARPTLHIISNHQKFFDPEYTEEYYQNLKNRYYSSQYAKEDDPAIITDETFEEFAGGAFLRGMNPILIVHDHPPLGRYIVSLSILLFSNAKTIVVFFFYLSLLGLFLIGKEVLKDSVKALLPIAVFANEPLLFSKLLYVPVPEILQFPFILFSFYFFIKAIQSKKPLKFFLLTSLMIGFVISTRFFVTGMSITTAMVVTILIDKNKKNLFRFILSLPIAILVLFLSYTKTIIDSESPLVVLSVQKYIYAYHKSQLTLLFSFWDLLLFNRWHTWWGDRAIITDPNWHILWPISAVLTLAHGILAGLKKIKLNKGEIVILIWLLFYTGILSVGNTSTRYFLTIIPLFYIISTSFIFKIIKTYNKNIHKK